MKSGKRLDVADFTGGWAKSGAHFGVAHIFTKRADGALAARCDESILAPNTHALFERGDVKKCAPCEKIALLEAQLVGAGQKPWGSP